MSFIWTGTLLKGTICKIFALKYPQTIKTMLYILLTCVHTLTQIYPTMF